MRLDALPDFKGEPILAWATKALHPTVHLVTDALSSLAAAKAAVANYGAMVVSPRRSSDLEAFRWVNTVIANLKTAMRGTYHHFNFAKYRARYLAEAQYRLNRRFDLASIVERLLGACVLAPPAPKLGCAAARSGATDAYLATDGHQRPRRHADLCLKPPLPAHRLQMAARPLAPRLRPAARPA